jgi:7-cyano-7-deazaguanine synthase
MREAAAAARAVVLLSGGLDSAVTMALALAAGREVHALSFAYGQRHVVELERARRQARVQGAASHRVVTLGELGASWAPASALVDGSALEVRRDGVAPGIPATYVPARNTVFLAHGLAVAEVLGARDVWIGVNAPDSSGYPDCTEAFVAAFREVARLGTRAGAEGQPIGIEAPLVRLRKDEIVRRGLELGVDLSQTVSCYVAREEVEGLYVCGACDSCRLRADGFARAGVADPARPRGMR